MADKARIYTSVTGTDSTETISASTITFPYIKKSHVEVRISNAGETLSAFKTRLAAGSVSASTINSHYTVADNGDLTFTSATLADGSDYQVELKRNSNIDARYVDFVDGSVVTESNLDDAQKQQIYLTQELSDSKATLKEDGSVAADITGNVTGNVTGSAGTVTSLSGHTLDDLTAGTTNKHFTATDETKLDGIEDSADVTDTANVTAAGALMDSELTDLAGVKGVTISTLQEKPSEGAFADGDKTKLDGIETSATADQTDAEIRTAVGNATDSNVFTDADHTKLDGLEQSDWNSSSGGSQILNKPTIPSALNDLSNVNASPSDGQVLKWVNASSEWQAGDDSGGGGGGGGGISHVSEDTSPQLGNHLDVNGKKIVSESNGDIVLEPDGTGRIGLGTSSPDTLVEAVGSDPVITIRDTETSHASASSTLRLAESGAAGALGRYFDVTKSGESFKIIDDNGGSPATRLTLDTSGNLGLGTVSASSRLHVYAGSSGATPQSWEGITLEDDDYCRINILTPDDKAGYLMFGSASDNDHCYIAGYYDSGSPNLRFITNGSERMRITSTGHLQTQSAGSMSTDSSAGSLSLYGGATDHGGEINLHGGSSSDGIITFRAGAESGTNDIKMTLTGTGLGIGTENPSGLLHLTASTDPIAILTSSTHGQSFHIAVDTSEGGGSPPLVIGTGTSVGSGTKLALTPGGSLGVGTSAPSSIVHASQSTGLNFQANSRAFFGSLHSTHFAVVGGAAKADDSTTSQMVSTETASSGNGLPSAIKLGAGNIDFHTASSSTAGAAFDSLRMRIDSSGNCAIGHSSADTILHTLTSSDYVAKFESTDGYAAIILEDGGESGSTHNGNRVGVTGDNLHFTTAGTERMRITSAGRIIAKKASNAEVTALTDGATITPDLNDANNFSVTLGGNRTLANPSNCTAGQSGVITITQDGTGSRTLAYGGYWKFSGGTAPTLTTTASAVDVLAYYVESATRITATLITDTK